MNVYFKRKTKISQLQPTSLFLISKGFNKVDLLASAPTHLVCHVIHLMHFPFGHYNNLLCQIFIFDIDLFRLLFDVINNLRSDIDSGFRFGRLCSE